MPRKSPQKPPAMVYQLKVVLQHIKPPIWRRLLVRADTPLDQLHIIIQIAMGWTNSHLHQFAVRTSRGKPGRGYLGAFRGEQYYSLPEFELDNAENEREFRLEDLAPGSGAKLYYEYDFGDGWEHEVLVEKVRPPEPGEALPHCVAGKRACPPEDIGGPWGHVQLLAARDNPRNEEQNEAAEFLQGFDTERFDCEEVNATLSELFSKR